MAFLTIFTAPKPFINPHIIVIQRNAIQAWKSLADVDVILVGDEPGIVETAKEMGVRSVPEVKRDIEGVPLVNSVMEIGHKYSDSPMLCYANGDMILMSDMVRAARQVKVKAKDFLLVGQRWDLELNESFDFSGDWEKRLRQEVARRGRFFSPWGIDYFIFPRHLFTQVPDFTIGRSAWDNWMVYFARANYGMAIDATRDVLAVHQKHDYSHLPGGQPHYRTEAAKSNAAKAGGRKRIFNVLDTNRELVHGALRRPQFRIVRLLRQLEHVFITDNQAGWSWTISLRLQQMQKRLAVKPRS